MRAFSSINDVLTSGRPCSFIILNLPRRDEGRRCWCWVDMDKCMHGRIAILVYKLYKCVLDIIVDMRSSICM